MSFGPTSGRSPLFKRKPFVSTTKRVATFGAPPPLPVVKPPVEREERSEVITVVALPSDDLDATQALKLQHRSARWLQLSSTLWSMLVIDANRHTDKANLVNFMTAMAWRVNDAVSEEEFTGIYLEWMGKQPIAKKRQVAVFTMRQVLLEQNASEETLDLYIGMIVNEINRRLINFPLNFDADGSAKAKPSLELCSTKWLKLSEELFFLLDTSGYGHIRFDEMFFLASCLLIGSQHWNREDQAEHFLSLPYIGAVTIQLFRDAGVHHTLSTDKIERSNSVISVQRSNSLYDESGHLIRLDFTDDNTAKPQRSSGKYLITVAMFKRLLLKKGIGEAGLHSLTQHIRDIMNLLTNLTHAKAPSIYATCHPCEESFHDNIGPPKLWQHAVLAVAGHVIPYPHHEPLPSVLSFLLCDCDRYINMLYLISDTSALLHDATYKLWRAYHGWNSVIYKSSDPVLPNSNNAEVKRDPVYQFMMSVLAQIKHHQKFISAACIDIAMDEYSIVQSPITIACAAMLKDTAPTFNEVYRLLHKDGPVPSAITPQSDISRESRNHLDDNKVEQDVVLLSNSGLFAAVDSPASPETPQHISVPETQEDPKSLLDDIPHDNNGWTPETSQPLAVSETMHTWEHQDRLSASGSTHRSMGSHKVEIDEIERCSDISSRHSKSSQTAPPLIATSIDDAYEMRLRQELEVLYAEVTSEQQLITALVQAEERIERDVIIERLRQVKTSISAPAPALMPPVTPKENRPHPPPGTPDSVSTGTPSTQQLLLGESSSFKQPHDSMSKYSETSSLASSVAELLEQGQSAGRYAQNLREILRKMSADDSKMQLKSLEQILKLGYHIAETESNEYKKSPHKSPTRSPGHHRSPQYGNKPVSPTRLRSAQILSYSNPDVITMKKGRGRIPGSTPRQTPRYPKKAFGYPV